MELGPNNFWQLSCEMLGQRIGYLIQSSQWSDCKFLVGGDSSKVAIDAHKIILATASPVFEAMFFSEMAESKNPILIPDIHPSTFKTTLRYIYTDDIQITSFDEAFNLYYAANKYILPSLEKKCIKYIDSNLNIQYAGRTYEFACLYNETKLMEKCSQLFRKNTKEILDDSSLEDLQVSTLVAICSLEQINCTELDLFEAAERYVKAHGKHIDSNVETAHIGDVFKLDSPQRSVSKDIVVGNMEKEKNSPVAETESAKQENSPSVHAQETNTVTSVTTVPESNKKMPNIRPVIEKIRFLTLTAEQFAAGPGKAGLLTDSEVVAILLNIVSSSVTDTQMPSGFSICRLERPRIRNMAIVSPQ